jgi:hypothetical protein
MRFSYSPDIETKICTHEDSMVEVFSALVETYRSKFDKYGCDIRLEQYWYNNGNVSLKRLPFSNGYTCAFSCSAEKNGKPLCVDVVEGNTLTVSWPISSIAEEIIPNILSFDEKYIRAEAELIGSTKHKGWAFQKEWRYKILFYPLSTSHDSIHKDHREAFKLFLEGYKPPFDYVDLKIGNQYFSDMEIITGPMMESETYDDFYNFVKVIAPFMKISKSIYTGTIRKRVFDIPNTP